MRSQFDDVDDFLPLTSIKGFFSRRAHKKQVAELLEDNEEEDKREEEQLQDDQEDEQEDRDEQEDEDDQEVEDDQRDEVVQEILHDYKKVINYTPFTLKPAIGNMMCTVKIYIKKSPQPL